MISTTQANAVLNCIMNKAELNRPADIYLGLCSTEPSADGTITDEPTAASYERKLIGSVTIKSTTDGNGSSSSSATYTSDFGTAEGGIISNVNEIQMRAAREAWGDMKYFFLSKTKTGVAYLWGKIYATDGTEGITVEAETVPVFYEGQLRASIDVALPPITEDVTETT